MRLLVVRLGAMGDVLHALTAVTALRLAHPGWQIDWAIEPRWLPLLSSEPEGESPSAVRSLSRPVVDRIYRVPTKAWGKRPLQMETWSAIGALRTELRAAEYDAVLDLQGAIRSGVVARFTGSRRIVGAERPWEVAAKWLYTERVATHGAHVIEQNVELASALAGDLLEPATPALPFDQEAEDWVDRHAALAEAVSLGRPVVLIHPGAGWGAKRWPAERYGAVAEEFAMRGGVVLVNAGPGEEGLAGAVLATSGNRDRTHVVSCTLAQLIAITRRVSVVIGGDTGPMHLACALGKPVVGIFGPTDPKRNGPFGCQFRVLRNPESRTDHARLEEAEAGLLTILPEAVISAVIELMLEERRARRSEAEKAEREESPADAETSDAEKSEAVWDGGQA